MNSPSLFQWRRLTVQVALSAVLNNYTQRLPIPAVTKDTRSSTIAGEPLLAGLGLIIPQLPSFRFVTDDRLSIRLPPPGR